MNLASVLFAAATVAAGPNAEVLAVERAISQAQVKGDFATIEASLAPGYTFTLPDGKIVTRDRFLADMRAWWRPLAVENSEQQVRVISSVAIINGKALYHWQAKGKPVEEAREQYTDTYAFNDGRWQRVASHSSCLSGRCT